MLSLLAMAVFILLVFSAGRINIFSDKADPDGDTAPAISALRTYFCILFLISQSAGSYACRSVVGLEWAKKAIIIFVLSFLSLRRLFILFYRAG